MKPAGRTAPSEAGPDRAGSPTSQKRAALVDQLLRLFEQAEEASTGLDDTYIDLAGRVVRLRITGETMSAQLLPALAHLRVDPTPNPALTVCIWDSASTSTPDPVAPWGPADFREQGKIRGFFGDGFYTVWDWGTMALNVVDLERGSAFLWMRDAKNLWRPERGAPLRLLWNLWLSGSDSDTQLVHAAAVGRPDASVLLLGPSGAGKSSTALSCLDSDLGHLGEDYCLVSLSATPTVASLYNSAKLEPTALSRLPALAEVAVSMPGEEDPDTKAFVDLHASFADKLIRSAPLTAIAIPRIAAKRETTSRRCSAGAALAAVAPSTILQMPGNGEPALRWLTELVTSVPCHELELGSDPSLIPPALEALLAGAVR